jgi:hypothetical protein
MSSTAILSHDRPIRLEAKSTVKAGALDSQIHASSRNARLDLNGLSTEIEAAYPEASRLWEVIFAFAPRHQLVRSFSIVKSKFNRVIGGIRFGSVTSVSKMHRRGTNCRFSLRKAYGGHGNLERLHISQRL